MLKVALAAATLFSVGSVSSFAAGPENSVPYRGDLRRAQIVGAHPEDAATGATIYLNEATSVFRSGVNPAFVYESLSVQPNGSALELKTMESAFIVVTPQALVMRVKFWDVFNAAASPVNSGQLGTTQLYDFGATPLVAGAYTTGTLPIAPIIPLSDPDIGIEITYLDRTSGLPVAGTVTVAFAGTGVSIGSSPDTYFRDANANGQFDSADARNFGGGVNLANFYLHIDGNFNPDFVPEGIDLLETPPGGTTFDNHDLYALGVFPDFDDFGASCVPVTSTCDPNLNSCTQSIPPGIVLQGVPLTSNNPIAPTDTIIRRRASANVPPGSSAGVPIEIVALSLVSAAPITVNYDDGAGGSVPTLWDVKVCLSDGPQSQGTMQIQRDVCPDRGGTFTASLPVLPKFIFTPVPGGGASCAGPVTFDPSPLGIPPFVMNTSGYWQPTAPPAFGLVENLVNTTRVDGNCDGALDPVLPQSSAFHIGVRVPVCPDDASCPANPPVKRLTHFVEASSAHAVLPAEAAGADSDGDGIQDLADNCVSIANPLQQDSDDDSVGNACDNCAAVCNPDQADSNGNGTGDVCESVDTDGDGVPDSTDNCPTVPNTNQADADGDNKGDVCDNCVNVSNPLQEDADSDTIGDACDCAPTDPTNAAAGSVGNLQAAADKTTFDWPAVPNATAYDVVRGDLSALPVGPGGGDEVCTNDLLAPTTSDASIPASGNGFFYVARGENACGVSGYGNATAGPRTTTTCP